LAVHDHRKNLTGNSLGCFPADEKKKEEITRRISENKKDNNYKENNKAEKIEKSRQLLE